MTQQYRCNGDTAGDQWTAHFDGNGLYYLSRVDSETRWVESRSLDTGDTRHLGPVETDPASFTTLLATGRDDFDFTTVDSTGVTRRYVGFDTLTGKTVTIDGVALEETRFESKTYLGDGTLIDWSSGQQYVSRDWRQFFPGTQTFENTSGDKVDSYEPPMEFSFPGDKDFLATDPKYDCDTVTAQLQVPMEGSLP